MDSVLRGGPADPLTEWNDGLPTRPRAELDKLWEGWLRKFEERKKRLTLNRVSEDVKHDPHVLELYLKALKEGKEEDRSIRINVVGNFGQGKTSLVRRLVGESIESVESTNGIECDLYKCTKEIDGTFIYEHGAASVDSEVGNRLARIAKEMSSQQKSRNKDYIKERHETFQSGEVLSFEFKLNVTRSDTFLNKTLATKSDTSFKRARAISNDSNFGKSTVTISRTIHKKSPVKQPNPELVQIEGFKKFEESIKEGTEETNSKTFVNIWDFGGQETFYATHTIFHSRKAIYLLVFNLSLELKDKIKDGEDRNEYIEGAEDKDMEYNIRYWVNSIHSFVSNKDSTEPHVILVGTHKDKLRGNDQEKNSQAEKKFEKVRKLFDKTEARKHIISAEFAVDNTDDNDKSVSLLRKTIIQLSESSKTELIPAKWIPLEKELLKRRHMKIISMEMLSKLDKKNEFPIDDVEQIRLFLKYYHNIGTFCYFDEEPISMYIVLDPQFLIDAFKRIITSSRFCRKDIELRPFWIKMFEEAKLEPKLIDVVWGGNQNQDQDFSIHKHILIEFLKKHHILSEAMAYDDSKQTCEGLGWYIVPCLLRYRSSDRTIAEYLRGKRKTLTRLVLTFDNDAVVPTIYQRVIAATLGNWPLVQFKDVFLMYENLLVVRLDVYNHGMLGMVNNHIELTVVGLCSSLPITAVIADGFRRFVESVVSHELRKRRYTIEGLEKPYVQNLRCNNDSHGLGGSKRLIQQFHEQPVEYYTCPDSVSHDDLVVQEALSEWFQERSCIQNVPRLKLSDKMLSRISSAFGHNWEFLGKQLDVTEIEIQHIKEDYPNSVEMRIYKMLSKWDQKKKEEATMDVLVQKVRSCPKLGVDWDILRNVIDVNSTDL